MATKQSILKKYMQILTSKGKVRLMDLSKQGITKDQVSHHFGSLKEIEKSVRKSNPNLFFDVPVYELIKKKHHLKTHNIIQRCKRFVVTTAVNGCKVDENFLASIESYCKKNDAALLVIMATDSAINNVNHDYGTVDKRILAHGGHLVLTDENLNSNIFISTLKLNAKVIDPISGLQRVGQSSGSCIYASPKQRLQPIPVSNVKMPRFAMTTGALTLPSYVEDAFNKIRNSYIANHDHKMGGLIIEIEDSSIYHFRQIQSDLDGSFIDFGTKYMPDGTTSTEEATFILGDWHSGETDPVVKSVWKTIITQMNIKKIFLHDLFNGMSINHHEQEQGILLAQRASWNQLSLLNELYGVAADLNELSALVDEIVIVKSNHDIFLDRYLQEGLYVKDPYNHRTSLELAMAMIDGMDPLKFGVENSGLLNKNKIKWLSYDEDYKIAGIELGAHGHQGVNGAKGSLRGMETAYCDSITGHSHTPAILRGSWAVGTSSFLKLSYNKGPSTWVNTSCLLYNNGSRQLINCINGRFKL